jgi:hypothetical protein
MDRTPKIQDYPTDQLLRQPAMVQHRNAQVLRDQLCRQRLFIFMLMSYSLLMERCVVSPERMKTTIKRSKFAPKKHQDEQ